MRVVSFTIVSSILLLLLVRCQQNKSIGVDDTNLAILSDTTKPVLAIKDYLHHFYPNTPYATNVLVYELKLDTAELVLISNEYRSLYYTHEIHPRDYLMLTNGGMFHPAGVPVGLFISDCDAIAELNQETNHGNFFLLPNGVFYVKEDNTAGVLETEIFYDSLYKRETEFKIATQSGPMLVIDGKHHPKFNQNSKSKYIRSGVGVTADQKVVFIISEEVVNLYTFASIFLEMGCHNALYLDGAISSMYIQEMGDDIRSFRTNYGPVLGVFKNKSDAGSIKKNGLQDSTQTRSEN